MGHMVEELDRIYTYDGLDTWHDINTIKGRQPADLEDAYVLSQLNWPVNVEPLRFEDISIQIDLTGQNQVTMGPQSQYSRAITTRGLKDERIELGGCGTNWTPLQNKELFERAHPFVENGFATYETAGSLRNRKSVWVSLLLGLDYVDDDDPIAKRMLFHNCHDTTSGAKAGWCPDRTVCNNTLSANLRAGRFLEIRHSKNVANNFQLIVEAMDVATKKWITTIDIYRKLSNVTVSNDAFDQYVTRCFISEKSLETKWAAVEQKMTYETYGPDGPDGELILKEPTQEEIEAARKVFEAQLFPEIREKVKIARETAPGARLKSAYGTAWGALNAITYVTTHLKGSSSEARLASNFFGGEGARINHRALVLAQKL